MAKDTFIAFMEWEDNCEALTDEEFGQLMRAVFKYAKDAEEPTFSDRTMRTAWKPIQQAIDRANEAYKLQCEANRKNGKKGGAPKGNKNASKQPKQPKQPKTSKTTLPNPNPDPYQDRRGASLEATARQKEIQNLYEYETLEAGGE